MVCRSVGRRHRAVTPLIDGYFPIASQLEGVYCLDVLSDYLAYFQNLFGLFIMSDTGAGAKIVVGAGVAAAVVGGGRLLSHSGSVISHTAPIISHSAPGLIHGEIAAGRVAEERAISSGAGGRIGRDAPSMPASGLHTTQIARMGHSNDSMFDNNAPLDVGKQADLAATRPIVIYPQGDPRVIVNRYVAIAEPKLVEDLTKLSPPVSKLAVESIVKNDLVTTAQNIAKAPDAKVSFDVLSGKLKVEASRVIAGVKVSGGEINVYVVGGGVTTAVMACNAVSDVTFKNCVDAAIRKAMSKAFDDIRPVTARNAD